MSQSKSPRDFLIELGTEELPPKALLSLSQALHKHVEKSLQSLELSFAEIQPFAAPRRLALLVKNLDSATPVKDETVWGPPVRIAYDADGKPSKAATAFAAKNGLTAEDLQTENDGKADKLVCRIQTGGEQTTELLEGIVSDALKALPIPKRMRWGANRHEFVRPVHWLVMLFGEDVIDAEVLGLKAGRTTRGHRFHCNQTLELASAGDYASVLKDTGYVLADFAARRELVKTQVETEAKSHGGVAVIDSDLLDEVTALVEWPVALTGRFEERFLSVPAEALISSMKEHQKYFHLVDQKGSLLPHFITVSNIESTDKAQVIDGNERVIRPRLADAAFFFETDKKTSLESKRERLKTVVFQAKLGTLFDKTERIAALAQAIADTLGVDKAPVKRAAELCKSDLVSDMVLEFSDMQGIAGEHYAHHDGEDEAVAIAMNQHYLPKYAGDSLPENDTAAIIALADRLDTLMGIFGIGEQPTGSKDPFALRRASVSVLRLLVEQRRDLDLRELLELAFAQYGHQQKALPEGEAAIDTALNYMLERFRAYYEEQDIPVTVFLSVSAKQLSTPLDIDQRVQAVSHFNQLPEAAALAAGNKRVANILAKVKDPIAEQVDDSLLQEAAEKNLAAALAEKQGELAPLFAQRDYQNILGELASLRGSVDAFFDDVMVMADDEALKNNRLALLQQLRGLFLQVADISCLAVSK